MSDFAVEYGVLAEYGASMAMRSSAAIDVIRTTRMDSPTSGMPGGLAAAAAGMLQGRYEAASARVGDHLAEHPRKLTESAESYRAAEDSGVGLVRESFGG